jgi:hypothetical protein
MQAGKTHIHVVSLVAKPVKHSRAAGCHPERDSFLDLPSFPFPLHHILSGGLKTFIIPCVKIVLGNIGFFVCEESHKYRGISKSHSGREEKEEISRISFNLSSGDDVVIQNALFFLIRQNVTTIQPSVPSPKPLECPNRQSLRSMNTRTELQCDQP